jgi:hypothetical protein
MISFQDCPPLFIGGNYLIPDFLIFYQSRCRRCLLPSILEIGCSIQPAATNRQLVLNAFELLTATYAAENFRLRDDWYGSIERKVAGAQPAMVTKKVLRGVQNTDFLQAITLINTYRRRQEDVRLNKPNDEITGVSCKRSAVLALSRADYQSLRDHVLTGFLRAAKFLTLEHIFLDRDLPYQTQLVPL